MKYYDISHNRLVFIQKKATSEFWDEHWNTENFKEIITSGKNDSFILKNSQKYLKTGRILEGGCGTGAKVFALHYHGYDAYGVDFAKITVKKINESVPNLQVFPADVRSLPFSSSTFDGYWSLGVIEHFYEGYESIADEIARVLKPGGFLFLTFPYMSPLRKLKAKVGIYHLWEESLGTKSFYQFALDKNEVIKEFERRGFQMMIAKPYNGIKGFKDEVQFSKPFLQYLYNYSGTSLWVNLTRYVLQGCLSLFASHTILVILKR